MWDHNTPPDPLKKTLFQTSMHCCPHPKNQNNRQSSSFEVVNTTSPAIHLFFFFFLLIPIHICIWKILKYYKKKLRFQYNFFISLKSQIKYNLKKINFSWYFMFLRYRYLYFATSTPFISTTFPIILSKLFLASYVVFR